MRRAEDIKDSACLPPFDDFSWCYALVYGLFFWPTTTSCADQLAKTYRVESEHTRAVLDIILEAKSECAAITTQVRISSTYLWCYTGCKCVIFVLDSLGILGVFSGLQLSCQYLPVFHIKSQLGKYVHLWTVVNQKNAFPIVIFQATEFWIDVCRRRVKLCRGWNMRIILQQSWRACPSVPSEIQPYPPAAPPTPLTLLLGYSL